MSKSSIAENLVVIPLDNKVLLPSVVIKLDMRGKDAVALTRKHLRAIEKRQQSFIACIPLTKKNPEKESNDDTQIDAVSEEGFIRPEDKDCLFNYGCTARIIRIQRAGIGAFSMIVEGIARFKVDHYVVLDKTLHAQVKLLEEQNTHLKETSDEMLRFKALTREFLAKMKDLHMPENLIEQLTKLMDSVSSPVLADMLVTFIETSFDEKLTTLATTDVKKRIENASEWMTRQLHVKA